MTKYTYADKNQLHRSCTHAQSTFTTLQRMASGQPASNQTDSEFTQTIIQYVINQLDADKTLQGLFRMIKFANKHSISPFLATQDYCIKVLSVATDGHVGLNISPIYHLGPEYPDYYKEKQGKDLNRDAIIGLIEIDTPDPDKPSKFNLGIDAGIAFQQAKIPHNVEMELYIQLTDDGIVASLSCEEQSTSKVFTWEQIGLSSTTPFADHSANNVEYIWAS